ncbi:CAP domain-containing protein [Streptomyces sp. NPDC004267]|uniref:CAP domain-containing protein n=1 Tax=Streptomyces sp. NPDC004267 TaxID=3364694 RepID=UPI0036CE72B3
MGRHRGARRSAPVRTGLLGVSTAVAAGAIAVAAGLLPGGETFTLGGTSANEQKIEAQQAPSLNTQGGASATPESTAARAGGPVGSGKAAAPSAPAASSKAPAPKPSAPKSTVTPSPQPTAPKTHEAPKASTSPAAKPVRTVRPTRTVTVPAAPAPTATVRSLTARESSAEAEVVRLVNAERAKVGCPVVRSDADLASLAGAFSADMAARGFFDHTDPDGATPWDRATKAGITGLGAENIARGQVDAAAVMRSWMASDGHRANILNCDYTVIGVGVHFGAGGPWWTQDFGT